MERENRSLIDAYNRVSSDVIHGAAALEDTFLPSPSHWALYIGVGVIFVVAALKHF